MKKVREGYKMTELGEIPNEWEVKRLGEIAEINPKKEVVDDDNLVSFIAMEDISNSGRVINKNDKLYGEVKKGYTGFRNNDVLLAKITPCFENGKRALVNDLSNGIGFGSTEFHVLRETKDSMAKYLYYVIGSHKFISKAENNMTGSAGQKRVPTEFLKEYVLAMPKIEEQEKIVSILSTVDEQIDNVDGLIEKNKELKKGLMQQLLTKGIGHTKFKKTDIGEIPEAWELTSFRAISKVSQGLQIAIEERYKDFKEGRLPYITIQYINNKLNQDNQYFIENYSDSVVCKKDDILMTRTGNTGIVVTNEIGVFHNNFFKVDFRRDLLNKEFLVYYLKTNFMKNLIIRYAGTTTIPDLKHGDFYKLPVVIPKIEEQGKIASILLEVDEKIEEYENKKQKLEEIKEGLMQQLLTGKIRVIK